MFKQILLMLVFFPVCAYSGDYSMHVYQSLIDAQSDIKRISEIQCKDHNNIAKEIACAKSVADTYSENGEVRGTDQYCIKHYYPLSDNDLENLLMTLLDLHDTARPVGSVSLTNNPGELKQPGYEVEIGCVAKELKSRNIRVRNPDARHAIRYYR
jgi:hypothetical protein